MAELQDSWKDVAGKAEALGLKLKLHLEQEKEASDDGPVAGDTKALVDELTRKVSDAFDSIGNAAKDPAVHDDVKDMGRLFRDALVTTFNTVGAEVSSRTNTTAGPQDVDSSVADATVSDAPVTDAGSGDEADAGDS